MDLAPDFNEFIASLNAHGVEFLIVGAYALAIHGAPRFTGDLEIFIRPTHDNAVRLLEAVRAFGFPVQELTADALLDPRRMLQMGIEPVQIHVMTAISGVTWDAAWRDHIVAAVGDLQTPVIGREAFLANKRAAGRPKDLADVDAIDPKA